MLVVCAFTCSSSVSPLFLRVVLLPVFLLLLPTCSFLEREISMWTHSRVVVAVVLVVSACFLLSWLCLCVFLLWFPCSFLNGMQRSNGRWSGVALIESAEIYVIYIESLMHFSTFCQQLKNAILLVYANKQDVKGAMTAAEISDALSLHG